MKKTILLLGLFLLTIVGLMTSSCKRPIHIFMAGDSTMADKIAYKDVMDSITGKTQAVPFPEKGWGQILPEYFNDNVVIKNFAKNGRSSKTFVSEGLWAELLSGVQKGDYVIIQFGHNDSSIEKGDRYSPPDVYYNNLSRFVEDVKARGGNAIICTSVARRRFDENGGFIDSHGVYLDMARKVAKDQGIPLIDMYEKSKKLLIDLGPEKTEELFMHFKSGESLLFPEGKIDNTHFREKGANLMAELFVQGLEEQKITDLTLNLVK